MSKLRIGGGISVVVAVGILAFRRARMKSEVDLSTKIFKDSLNKYYASFGDRADARQFFQD